MALKDKLLARLGARPAAVTHLPVTDELIRQIADHINNGRPDEASALAKQTADPQRTGLLALHYTN